MKTQVELTREVSVLGSECARLRTQLADTSAQARRQATSAEISKQRKRVARAEKRCKELEVRNAELEALLDTATK